MVQGSPFSKIILYWELKYTILSMGAYFSQMLLWPPKVYNRNVSAQQLTQLYTYCKEPNANDTGRHISNSEFDHPQWLL